MGKDLRNMLQALVAVFFKVFGLTYIFIAEKLDSVVGLLISKKLKIWF